MLLKLRTTTELVHGDVWWYVLWIGLSH